LVNKAQIYVHPLAFVSYENLMSVFSSSVCELYHLENTNIPKLYPTEVKFPMSQDPLCIQGRYRTKTSAPDGVVSLGIMRPMGFLSHFKTFSFLIILRLFNDLLQLQMLYSIKWDGT